MRNERTRRQRALRRMGFILIFIGLMAPIAVFGFMTTPASELSNWTEDSSQGDRTLVFGRIKEESRVSDDYYLYELDGSGETIYSKRDIANKGEWVFLNVEKDDATLVVEGKYSILILVLPTMALIIVGMISLVLGTKTSRPLISVTDEDVRFCSTCGFVLEYAEDYDRWYCYKCKAYEKKVYRGTLVRDNVRRMERTKCPSCGKVFPVGEDPGGWVECPSCGSRGRI